MASCKMQNVLSLFLVCHSDTCQPAGLGGHSTEQLTKEQAPLAQLRGLYHILKCSQPVLDKAATQLADHESTCEQRENTGASYHMFHVPSRTCYMGDWLYNPSTSICQAAAFNILMSVNCLWLQILVFCNMHYWHILGLERVAMWASFMGLLLLATFYWACTFLLQHTTLSSGFARLVLWWH